MNKYIDETGEMLHDIAMNEFYVGKKELDDQFGSVHEDGIWVGLILEHNAIIQEDDQGSFDYKIFESDDEAQKAFILMWKEYIHTWAATGHLLYDKGSNRGNE